MKQIKVNTKILKEYINVINDMQKAKKALRKLQDKWNNLGESLGEDICKNNKELDLIERLVYIEDGTGYLIEVDADRAIPFAKVCEIQTTRLI